MLKKALKPEKVAGIVALSYLVLIPAAGFVAWRKVQLIQQDVDTLWSNSGMPLEQAEPIVDLRNWRSWVRW